MNYNYQRYQLELLAHNATITWIVSSLNALIVFYIFEGIVSPIRLYGWVLLFAIIMLGRIVLHWRYKYLSSRGEPNTALWLRFYEVSAAVGGLAWGLCTVLLFVPGYSTEQAFLVFVIAGMSAGGVISLSASKRAYIYFSLAIVVPWLSIMIYNAQSEIQYGMTLMLVFFLMTCLVVGKRVNDNIRSIFKLTEEREQLLRKNNRSLKQFKKVSKVKSQFLASMSHEIRTPLNALLGAVEIITSPNWREEEKKQYTATARLASDSILTLINDVLDLSKIEAGRVTIETTAFNLEELITAISKTYEAQAARKSLYFRTESSINQKWVKGDPVRIQQILGNLISNALKFTHQGGVTLRIFQERNYYVFEVKDTGIGITKKQQGKIFKPFVQADSTTTRKYGGTGLGLAISQELARHMQGRIELASEIDKGSAFTLYLPLKITAPIDALAPTEEARGPLSQPVAALKILLAEDNHTNQLVFSAFIRKFGYNVDTAENGKQAVEMQTEKPYDVIFMDLDMPVMDGFEATQIILSKHPQTHIYALTANVLPEAIDRCTQIGMKGYLSKPLNTEEIRRTLDREGGYKKKQPD